MDTWKGDEHSGFYGEEVYKEFRRFHDQHFGAFSEVLRCKFDEALPYIEDNSIDILHIDGLHTYETVKHDFDNWLPKLSSKAVVLFHDTNVRERDFGVWRLWKELCSHYRAFEFLHGHGLGILAVGEDAPAEVISLCGLENSGKDLREYCQPQSFMLRFWHVPKSGVVLRIIVIYVFLLAVDVLLLNWVVLRTVKDQRANHLGDFSLDAEEAHAT